MCSDHYLLWSLLILARRLTTWRLGLTIFIQVEHLVVGIVTAGYEIR